MALCCGQHRLAFMAATLCSISPAGRRLCGYCGVSDMVRYVVLCLQSAVLLYCLHGVLLGQLAIPQVVQHGACMQCNEPENPAQICRQGESITESADVRMTLFFQLWFVLNACLFCQHPFLPACQ